MHFVCSHSNMEAKPITVALQKKRLCLGVQQKQMMRPTMFGDNGDFVPKPVYSNHLKFAIQSEKPPHMQNVYFPLKSRIQPTMAALLSMPLHPGAQLKLMNLETLFLTIGENVRSVVSHIQLTCVTRMEEIFHFQSVSFHSGIKV